MNWEKLLGEEVKEIQKIKDEIKALILENNELCNPYFEKEKDFKEVTINRCSSYLEEKGFTVICKDGVVANSIAYEIRFNFDYNDYCFFLAFKNKQNNEFTGFAIYTTLSNDDFSKLNDGLRWGINENGNAECPNLSDEERYNIAFYQGQLEKVKNIIDKNREIMSNLSNLNFKFEFHEHKNIKGTFDDIIDVIDKSVENM